MPVQIVITGDHATDAIAELQNLATALNGPAKNEAGAKSNTTVSTPSAPTPQPQKSTSEETTSTSGETTVAPKEEKLSRTEQENAMKEMIEAGEKDERFDLLTKGRAAKVEKALEDAAAEPEAEDKTDADLSDMFDDDEDDTPEEVTSDMIRAKMGELGKDANGAPIQDNLLKIREILTTFVPKGEEIKVGRIPQDKLAEVYAALQELEG